MRELRFTAAIVAVLAAAVVLAQDELQPAAPSTASKPAAPPTASEPAGAGEGRANPFSPLDSAAAPTPASPSLEPSPSPAALPQTAALAPAKLQGILYCESKPLVVINDLIAGVGDEVAGMRVTAIARDKVTLAGPRGVWVMTPLQPEARPAPAVPPAPAEAGEPAVEPETEASAESQAPEAAGSTPIVAAESTDQPNAEESP